MKDIEGALCDMLNDRLKKPELGTMGIRSTAIPDEWPIPASYQKELEFYLLFQPEVKPLNTHHHVENS